MHLQTQFSIFLVNKPGVLANVTDAMAKAKINILALTLMDSLEHGVLRVVTDNAEATREVLTQVADHWTESDVLVTELDNKPGAFAHITNQLASSHINVSYAYCTGGAPKGRTTGVFKVADARKAMKLFPPKSEQVTASRGKAGKAERSTTRVRRSKRVAV